MLLEAERVLLNLFSLGPPPRSPGPNQAPTAALGTQCESGMLSVLREPLSLAGGPGRGRPAQGGGALGLPPHAGADDSSCVGPSGARKGHKRQERPCPRGSVCTLPPPQPRCVISAKLPELSVPPSQGFVKWAELSALTRPRVVVRKVWAHVHSPWDRARCTGCCVNNSDRGTEPTARLARCPSVGAAWAMPGFLLWATPSPQKVLLERSLDTARSLSWGFPLTEAHLWEAFWTPDTSLSPVIVF